MSFITLVFQILMELISFNMDHKESILYYFNILNSERERKNERASND